MKRIFLIIACFQMFYAHGQLNIYSDQGSLVTGVWEANGVFSSTGSDAPFEGSQHFRFDYNITEYWAGIGLNMDSWDTAENRDFSGYTHLSIAYRGLSSETNFSIALRADDVIGNTITVGGSSVSYQVVDIPLQSLISGTTLDLTSISEITLSVNSSALTASGTVYFDDVKLITKVVNSGTNQETWARFGKMRKGFNFSNWLEAYWLFPFNTYPDPARFTRSIVGDLVNLGFDSARLPVTFERLAGSNPPYNLDTTSVAFALIDSAILWALDFDFPLIITNHHGFELTDANFESEIPRVRAVWQQVREKYGSLDPERFFFELSNEPTNAISNENFHSLADSLIKDFRSEGLTHSLIIGGNGYNSATGLLNTRPYNDRDIIYTFHSYDPYFFTHQQMSWTTPPNLPARAFPNDAQEEQALTNQINGMLEWSQTYNLPVFLGEFGASTGADANSRCNYVSTISTAFNAVNMPYFYWDATSPSDAFGFIENGDAIDCFAEALKLEAFNTCNLTVTNTTNIGIGSLRNALSCANENDTIRIDPSLSGESIDLKLPSLFIQKNLTIMQEESAPTFIDGNSDFIVIEVLAGKTLTLKNMKIQQSPEDSQPIMKIRGQVNFQNVTLEKN